MAKAKRHESKFYTIFKHSFEAVGGFYLKIPDSFGQGGEGVRFHKKKPYDLQICHKGINIYCEVKYYSEFKAFSLKNLRPHQVEALDTINNNANDFTIPLVALGVYRPREIKRLYLFHYEWLKNYPLKKAAFLTGDYQFALRYLDIKSSVIPVTNKDGIFEDKRVDNFGVEKFLYSIIK